MLPEFPAAQEAIKAIWYKRLFKALGFSDPLVSQIPLRVQKEGTKLTIGASEMEFKPVLAECKWKTEIGYGIPFDEYFALADQMGSDLARQQAIGTFKKLSEKESPRHVLFKKPKDGEFSFDDFISKLDGMEIDFDSQRMPKWPSIFLAESELVRFYKDLKANEQDENRRRRMEELVAKKLKEFDEREARRRLVD